MLSGFLMRSAWMLPPDRAEWLEGLVAEAAEFHAGRGRVAWLLGGVWLLAGELLRRSADPGVDVCRRGGNRRLDRLARQFV